MTHSQGAKRLMDVEDVVRWALSRPADRGAAPQGTQICGGMNVPRSEASLVGRWTWPASFPSISPMFAGGYATGGVARPKGPIDPDAAIVEAAIGEIGEAMAGLAAPEAIALDIGLPVDIDGAVAAALANVKNLVLAHGRLGNRPAYGIWAPQARARRTPNGKPGVWKIERWREPTINGGFVERDVERPVQPMRRDLYPAGSYGLIDWDPDAQLIVNDRAEYFVWRMALEALCAALSERMARIAALPPAAALAPWFGELDGDKPRDLFGPGAERVYSRLEAQAVAARRETRERRRVTTSGGVARRPARPGRGAASGSLG